MEYRALGKTGLNVSVLGFGASSLGGTFGQIDENDGIRTVHLALEMGVNFIDVSPYYGNTKAETMLGKALSGIPRDRYILATKVGRYGDKVFDFSREHVMTSIDESLKRLQVDYVDLIQCHDIEHGSLTQIINETIPALLEVKAQGKVRFIGVTGFPLAIYPHIIESADIDTILSYCHYSLNNTTLTELIPLLQANEVGIINASPLSMGLLNHHGPPPWHPAPPDVKRVCAQAVAFCQEQGIDIAKLAVQFSVANANINTTLVGTADPDDMRKNITCLDDPLETEAWAQVKKILKPIKNQSWISGRHENN